MKKNTKAVMVLAAAAAAALQGCAAPHQDTGTQEAAVRMCAGIGELAYTTAQRRDQGDSKSLLLSKIDSKNFMADTATGIVNNAYGDGKNLSPTRFQQMYKEICMNKFASN